MEALVLVVAGIVSTFVSQLVKRGLKISGNYAILLAYGIALIISLGVAFFSGVINNLGDIVENATLIFGTSALAYQLIIKATAVETGIDRILGTSEVKEGK